MSDKNQRVILFDGVCGLCNAWVDFVLKQDSEGKFQFAPLQGKFASEFATMEANELSSIVYRVEGVNFKKSGAGLRAFPNLLQPPFCLKSLGRLLLRLVHARIEH